MKQLPILFASALLLTSLLTIAQGEVELDEITPETATEETATITKIDKTELLKNARVFESDEQMSQGIQNAIVVELAATDKKLVEGVWKKYMKDYGGKTKKSKGGRNEFTTTGAEIVGINGISPITVYSRVAEGESGNLEMATWFDLGDEFLESRRSKNFGEAERMLQKFAHEVKIESTREELKKSEKKLRALEGNLNQLARQNESYHRSIESYEMKIEEAKENIVTNEEQQVDTGKKIDLQKQLIDEIDRRLRMLRKQ